VNQAEHDAWGHPDSREWAETRNEGGTMKKLGIAALALFVGTVFAANWLVSNVGLVPVGFGLLAPAGVYVVGLAFTLRDVVQDTLGKRWVVAAIAAGAVASLVISPALAVASATAFALSEIADFFVYTPMRNSDRPYAAVVASNAIGLVVDSAVFLWLAFGSLEFLPGQVVGKAWMTLAALPLVFAYRRWAMERVTA
jgi:uncharacterized PurR-regulated membrane protein YhhQ (DUF165 family)